MKYVKEIMLYLNQYVPIQDWRAVAIFPNRQTQPQPSIHYQELFVSDRIKTIYLDELTVTSPLVGLAKLIVIPEDQVIASAQQLITNYREVAGLLEFVETILVYKLKHLTREEIEAMFTLGDLKPTRVYQEGKQEGKLLGKLEAVPKLYALGLTATQIAHALELDIELVQQHLQQQT